MLRPEAGAGCAGSAGLKAGAMKLLFLGDVMGRSGRAAVADALPRLRRDWGLDFVVVNGENASGGVGLSGGAREAAARRRAPTA